MNILQILPSLDIGGVETGTVDLARYLSSHGHKAIIVSGGGRLVAEAEAAGARHYNLPVGNKSIFSMLRMIGALRDIIRSEDIDIVHARSRVPAAVAYFACRSTGRTFITTAHGYYSKHIMSVPISWGKYVIVASNIMAKHMSSNFAVPYERIRLIPRGVDLERFRFAKPKEFFGDSFVVGMVSRITPLKGHADFIKAVSILRRQIAGIKAVIVGSAPKEKYREELEILVRRLGLSDIVEFGGARQDVPEVMRGLDCLVSATTTPEAFGRVIIEAQASGVCVVATRVGGVVDIIDDGKTGLLCEARNPADMAEKIARIYKDDQLRISMAIEARKKVESDFNLEKMMKSTIQVYEEALKSPNILVIKMSAIGDIILSVPSLRAIRAKYPDAKIKVLVGLRFREVLDNCPYINDRIVCDFKVKNKGLKGLLSLAAALRRECFDMVIDLQNNKKSHILAYLSMAPLRYGYDNGKMSFLLNKKIKDDAPYLNPIEHQLRTLKMAGVKDAGAELELWPSRYDDAQAARLLNENWLQPSQTLVGINVRASDRWLSKNWPPSYIAEFCDRLACDFNVRAVLTGAEKDSVYAAEIARLARSKPVNLAGKTTILELASLMRYFKLYVTPDSAPMHVACAMGTPLIALFGPTDPTRHLSPSKDCVVFWKGHEMKCSPCYKSACQKKITCLKKITVDEVLEAAKPFLAKEGSYGSRSNRVREKEGVA
ncbi:MAG: lipopolysaccharide heptosyltransferase II [Candidatus Omnitrophica bacterium]|nr:lipopolysaccharide heptosyltransferase II [Candidatus Omnitrophota bacterium]MCM8790938.1 lipopolysaccharide heptosyltransferase II [Candidatus Omnitrophota bacterium]